MYCTGFAVRRRCNTDKPPSSCIAPALPSPRALCIAPAVWGPLNWAGQGGDRGGQAESLREEAEGGGGVDIPTPWIVVSPRALGSKAPEKTSNSSWLRPLERL